MKTNPNDNVYPVNDSAEITLNAPGLTKLEHFAGLAMQGLCAAQIDRIKCDGLLYEFVANRYAKDAIMLAKALITQLNKEQ